MRIAKKCIQNTFSKIYSRRRNGIIQGLLRSHSVKSEESPGCGGGTGPAGDDGTSHEICKQIANSQTAHGHGRPRARVDRTQPGKPPATCLPGGTSRRRTRPENLSRVRTRQDLIHRRRTDEFNRLLNFPEPEQQSEFHTNFGYISGIINTVCLVSITATVSMKCEKLCYANFKGINFSNLTKLIVSKYNVSTWRIEKRELYLFW